VVSYPDSSQSHQTDAYRDSRECLIDVVVFIEVFIVGAVRQYIIKTIAIRWRLIGVNSVYQLFKRGTLAVVKTPAGGLHVHCRRGLYLTFTSNYQSVKCVQ